MITGMPRIAIAVHDFPAVVATFRDKLGMPVIDISDSSVESLGASLAMCVPPGGSNIELMSPADPSAPLSQSLSRFLERRGEGLFALMLEAPDPDAEAELLLERGLNVLPLMAGAGGRDIHPNSTHGVLIRVYPVNSFAGQADADSGSDSPGLSGISRAIIAVRDLECAMDDYGRKLALDMGDMETDDGLGVGRARCTPPSGGLIELVSVSDESRPFAGEVSAFLDRKGEGMFALVLESEDPAGSAERIKAAGVQIKTSADSADVFETSLFGTCLRIEPAATTPA